MSENQQYPSLSQQANNIKKSALSTLKGIMRGESIFASEEIKNKRLEICNSCDRNDKKQGRCLECGCVLEWKIPMALSECPIQKWDTDDISILNAFDKNLDKEKESN